MKIRALIAFLFAACVIHAAPVKVSRDWRWVQGAVFVPTNAVNEAQQWDEYDPAINDRELHYASIYGINLVRVYLHYYVYLKKRDALLHDLADFLARANRYGIKTDLVFFDDCWNQPSEDLLSPGYRYPAPLPGVHNSRWLVSPGASVQAHYAENRARLQAYVQDIVRAHLADPRIAFWEIYNEPNKSAETLRLEQDAAAWIKATGTAIPATATGREFSGDPFSDFASWHEYGGFAYIGPPDALNTECMNRRGQSVPEVVRHFKGRTGFIVWELGIGRDNCRFTWDDNRDHPRAEEPAIPFHGLVYPDGHPWAVDDVKALLGAEKFAATPFFKVTYFRDGQFYDAAKISIVPFIDFDLVDEAGVGSPDASARIPKDNFSVAYAGSIAVDQAGEYTFVVQTDGRATLEVDGKKILGESAGGRSTGEATLSPAQRYPVVMRYVHGTGPAKLHVLWSGPDFSERPLMPADHPE